MIIWGDPPKNCPVCGRFLKVTREPILKVDGTDSGEIRIVRRCTNSKVNHDMWGD